MVAGSDSTHPPSRPTVLLSAGLAAVAVAGVALVNPHQSGHYPTCPLLALTGLYCPLCGGLRATYDLAHLDVGAALARNPLVVLAVPLIALAWFAWAQRAYTDRRPAVVPAWLGTGILALLVGFGVLRNVPGWDWLSPA
ncbi:MAG: hypothetical protein JWQ74_1861 [Marmoricola sp.]|nr:hypothetical protein [Marmoricola sp.]